MDKKDIIQAIQESALPSEAYESVASALIESIFKEIDDNLMQGATTEGVEYYNLKKTWPEIKSEIKAKYLTGLEE